MSLSLFPFAAKGFVYSLRYVSCSLSSSISRAQIDLRGDLEKVLVEGKQESQSAEGRQSVPTQPGTISLMSLGLGLTDVTGISEG